MINWPSQEGELRAEIDRLRAELAAAVNSAKNSSEAAFAWKGEIDRLRSELVELRPYCETLNRRLMEAGDELKRLRAENERLRAALERIAKSALGSHCREIAREALAKTAKEGE